MQDIELRAFKVAALRTEVERLRGIAAEEDEPGPWIIRAALLEQRAIRVAAGEDDHSGLLPTDW